jgi:Rps23 Pro-64 3,4-dihydroxylase Tpa1-like proline 4-hydroxylase
MICSAKLGGVPNKTDAPMAAMQQASVVNPTVATSLTRATLAERIVERLRAEREGLARQWRETAPVNYFVVDDVLPHAWASQIRAAFPQGREMTLKRSWRELKYVAAQMDRYHPLLEESLYAFQMPEVVGEVERATGLIALEPDEMLYAGGISLMAPRHFLNPHVDNSHDKLRRRYRLLNLLYYVSSDWSEAHGCNLELWPQGPEGKPLTIVCRFNRLVVMGTHQGSWHSVSRNLSTEDRCCVSNYYFSCSPPGGRDYFHVTSFRGRPEQPLRDLALRADIRLRMAIRKVFPHGIRPNPHFYARKTAGAPERDARL